MEMFLVFTSVAHEWSSHITANMTLLTASSGSTPVTQSWILSWMSVAVGVSWGRDAAQAVEHSPCKGWDHLTTPA